MLTKSPLVSVIIPMYNSAKFIPQTLESLLYQTMTDFEVIVIDDCSTDKSVEVVESFAERFGGRLNIIKLPKNTGMPGIPRNMGIKVARGKYIAFLDSDDLYTKTALEEVATLLENYQADILYLNDTYRLFKGNVLSFKDPRMTDFAMLTNPKSLSLAQWRDPLLPRPKPVAEPTFESDNLAERVRHWVEWKYRAAMCSNFCRRDFLIENDITFPDMVAYEDHIFNFTCVCLAKKILFAPNVVYIIRKRLGSASRDKTDDKNLENYFHKWINILKIGFNELEKFMARLPFFATRANYRHAVLRFFFTCLVIRKFTDKYSPNDSPLIYQFLKKEFHPDDAALSSFLFDLVNVQRLKILELQTALQKISKD